MIAKFTPLKKGIRIKEEQVPTMDFFTAMGLVPGEEYKVSIDHKTNWDGDWSDKICKAGPAGIRIGFPSGGGFYIETA